MSKPCEFTGCNVVFGKEQPGVQPLPALRLPNGQIITCWEFTPEEMEVIKETGKVYIGLYTGGVCPPQYITPLLEELGMMEDPFKDGK